MRGKRKSLHTVITSRSVIDEVVLVSSPLSETILDVCRDCFAAQAICKQAIKLTGWNAAFHFSIQKESVNCTRVWSKNEPYSKK
jgi:hypothetical protein